MAYRSSFNKYTSIPRYPRESAEELRMKARASMAAAAKKGEAYEPAIPHARSRTLCSTWWGSSWCDNLERYPEYSNRLIKGKRYLSYGAVLDLKIRGGLVTARIQGSGAQPYDVMVKFRPVSQEKAEEVLSRCGSRIENLDTLISGEFPEDMKAYFSARGGLFPTPKDISFHCSCAGEDSLCPHVAASLYGIGLRLDENPFYFFYLRGLNVDDFIDSAVQDRVESMLWHKGVQSPRIMEEKDIYEVFGFHC